MQKNILFIHHSSTLGGAERFLLSLIEGLDKKYKVFFICQEAGPLSEALAKEGVIVNFMPLPAWRKMRYLMSNLLRVKRIIDFCRHHKIDLICSNNYRVTSYAVWPARFLRVPVVTLIQDFVPRYKLWKFNTFFSDVLIAVSDALAKPIRRYSRKEVVTIYNGIDTDTLLASLSHQDILRSQFPALKAKRVMGMVAQVVPLKRHKLFLEAMQAIIKEYPDVMAVIIGESPSDKQLSLNDLRAYARDLKIEDKVIFTGSRSDVFELMKSFDILIHPADKEPFGRVIMEAMALGVPVVATASGGPSEIIEDGKSGFLVKVGDQGAIVDKACMLLKDQHLRETVAKEAQARVRRDFSLPKTVYRLNDVFDKLLSRKIRPS